MKSLWLVSLTGIMIGMAGCGGQKGNSPAGKNDSAASSSDSVSAADKIPLTRDSVSAAPVAEYKEKTDNPLNDWYFSVKLFETPRTFYYLMKLQFEEVKGEDTLKLPNFGIVPKPVIEKGPEKYSCIIGFMDKDNQFREYKKVYMENNHLKVVALKHYAVVEK
jgi:hypothetical protein